MSVPSRMQDNKLVLSKLKQGAYGTALTDVNLIAGKRYSPLSPVFGHPISSFWDDRNTSMRGTDFSEQTQETQRDLQESLSFNGDSWLLAYCAAFAMGKVVSTQPNAGGNPTAWQHVFKPMDPAVDGKILPVTTIYTEAGGTGTSLRRRILDCCFSQLAITFPSGKDIQIAASVIGSGRLTTGDLATPPALSTMVPLMSNDMIFKYGTQGGPADISSEIVNGSVKFTFTWKPDDGNSRAPGGGLFRSRMWVGQPDITVEFQRFVDDTSSEGFDTWLAGTRREIDIIVPGPQIGAGPEKHQLQIFGRAVVPDVQKLGQQGDKTIYQYTIGPNRWFKEGAHDVMQFTVTNLETSWFA